MSRACLTATAISALALCACARDHSKSFDLAADGGGSNDAVVDPNAHVGAKAVAVLAAVSSADAGVEIGGSASFSETADGVDLDLYLAGCVSTSAYPVVIAEGSDCSVASLLGAHWDSPRGDDIAPVVCSLHMGGGHAFYTRSKSDAKHWTIGNPQQSNLLGHVLVVFDPATLQPLACGQIVRAPDAPHAAQAMQLDAAVPVETRAVLAGLCVARAIVRDNSQECPNPSVLTACATEHCELAACVAQCTDYLACVAQSDDVCQAQFSCNIPDVCKACESTITSCVLGFCADTIACATPITPGGPCSQLEACCAMQGDAAAMCLDTVHTLEKLSGDPSCYGAIMDWDINAHFAVPCKFK